jgi:PST family polysaccharide transporter
MKDLKQRTIRGGLARLIAQGANFFLRLGSLMVLARLLAPKDFGLVGMVTAFTGVLSLFRDFGLSAAAVQRDNVTQEQVSTLFWINMLVGGILAVLALAMAPAIAAFYHEPRLIGVTAVVAAGFLFNAAGVQHSALLQRQMRFTALAVINTLGLVVGTAIANRRSQGRLRILVTGGYDGHDAPGSHNRLLDGHGLGSWTTAPWFGCAIHDAVWFHPHR